MTIVKTYQQNAYTGAMVHDGYFILVDGLPLKWASVEQIEGLQNAQEYTTVNYTAMAEEVRTV